MRSFVLHNVQMWIRDFHLDGLRLDATHAIFDRSPRHILRDIAEVAHAEGRAAGREVHVIAEHETIEYRLVQSAEQGGFAFDGQWNDNFHHAVHVLLTGERRGYYEPFCSPAKVF